jgi:hypothetical protein
MTDLAYLGTVLVTGMSLAVFNTGWAMIVFR